MKNNKKGFTIVELVIVIAIVAVLAAVLIPTFSNVVDKAKESKDYANALNIYKEQILALKSSNSLIDKDGDNKEEILVILESDEKTKYYSFLNGKGTLLAAKPSLDEYDLVFNEDGLDSSIITEIDAVKQKSMIAYNEYKLTNENANNYCFLYQEGSYYVVISKGSVYAVTDDAEEYINLLNGLVDNPNTDGIDGEFILTNTQNSQLFKFNCVKRRIYIDANKRLTGSVDSIDGNITTTHTNNWYYDVQIPEGSKKVEILSFKTGKSYGSVFFDDSDTVISGYCNTKSYQRETIDIPENATMYRYGYVIDSIAKDSPIGVFEYLTFFGDDISYEIQPKKINTIVKESFSVQVNIASALNKDEEVIGTDYGYIMLPRNYDELGDPVRLIIVCHGAGAKLEDYKSNVVNEHSQTYWLDMGYAIMDMFACPVELANGSELHFGNPTVLECYKKGYEYVMEKYNLKKDGIFVLGSSMGGLSSFQIVQSGEFPVLAQVANCPVIDLYKQAYCNPWSTASTQREKISSYFGFEGNKPTFTNTKNVLSNEEIEYFKNNFDKIIDYSPIFANVTAETSSQVINTMNKLPNNAIVLDSEEAALYQNLIATNPCPLLIIHNKNDATVSYRYSEYLKGMLERGGSSVELILYDTGDHNAWNNGPQDYIENYFGEKVLHSESRRKAINFFRSFEN